MCLGVWLQMGINVITRMLIKKNPFVLNALNFGSLILNIPLNVGRKKMWFGHSLLPNQLAEDIPVVLRAKLPE